MIKVTVFLAILLSAFFLRIYKFGETFGFFGDQGQDLLAILNWFETGNVPLVGILTSIGSFHMGPFYYYLIAPFVFILNGAPVSPALLFLISGVFLVGFVYWMLDKFIGPIAAIVGSLIFALSPHLVFISKGAYVPNLEAVAVILMIFCLVRTINDIKANKSTKYIFLTYLILGIGVQLHYTFLANLISVTLLILIFSPRAVKNYKYYLSALAGFLLPLIPFILGQFQSDFYDFKGIWQYILHSDNRGGIVSGQTIIDRLTFPFIVYFPADKLPYYLNYFVKAFFLLCLSLAGFIAFSKNKLSFFAKLLLAYFLISVLLSLLGRLTYWWWYYDFFSVVVLLLITLIITYLYKQSGYLRFGWIGVFSLFIWWQIFYLPDVYQIPRTAGSTEEVAQIIVDDLSQNNTKRPVGIYINSPTTLREGFEYRYLIEMEGLKTYSTLDPLTADYVIYESAGDKEIGLYPREGWEIKALAKIKLKNPGNLIKFAKVYKINQSESR